MIAALKSEEMKVRIDLHDYFGALHQGLKLRLTNIHAVPIRIDQYDDVEPLRDRGFQQPPALRNNAAGTISRHCIAISSHGNKNGAGFRAAVSQDVQTHSLGGPAVALIEHPGNIASRPDTLPLPKPEAGCAPFVNRHGNQYFFFSLEMLSLARPFARRLFRTSRPLFVFMRALNPNFLTRRVLLG